MTDRPSREEVSDKVYERVHGGPYDRGGADAWYGRKPKPHKYPEGTYNGAEVILEDPEEIKAYWAGYYNTYDDPTARKEW